MLDSGQVIDSAILPDGAVREHSVTIDAEDLAESIRATSQSPSGSSGSEAGSAASPKSAEQGPVHYHPVVLTNADQYEGLPGA